MTMLGKGTSHAALVFCILSAPTVAFGQASATFNGRVVDAGNLVLPGVSITATNTGTGVVRTSVTNEEGLYSIPGLEPGTYAVKAELAGFAPLIRERVGLVVDATLTLDFKLGLAGVTETLTVTGAAPLIEVSQSKVTGTIRTQEVESLPLLTRQVNALVSLLPGAKPVAPHHPFKRQTGSVSIGGGTGANVTQVVDGGDNRDNIVGGESMSFTMEGIEEFRVNTHQFSAADGRTSGGAVVLHTKSGTNQYRGSGFFYGRDRELTAKDFFTARDNLPKLPYNRQQFGGSFGGPIVRNRAFYFGAIERVREKKSLTLPDYQYSQLQLLVPFGAQPSRTIVQPYRDTMYTIKSNLQLNDRHSLIARFAGQKNYYEYGEKTQATDLSGRDFEDYRHWDLVIQHSWIKSSRTLNQLTFHPGNHQYLRDYNGLTGGPYFSNYPNAVALPVTNNLIFPSVRIGASGGSYTSYQKMWQVRDDLTLQFGSHAIRVGGDVAYMPTFGGECCLNWGQLTFFDDPSVIVNNTNGRYPQGFQTPGIVQRWVQSADIKTNNYILDYGAQVKAYIQDDWRVGSQVTVNLGVRYDLDVNFYGQSVIENNLTYQALRAIGHPAAVHLPNTPTKSISPRVGLAYDVNGDGRRVLRGGYGLYFDGAGITTTVQTIIQSRPPIAWNATRVNTGIGVGQLATFRLGIDPLPARPAVTDRFPPGGSSEGRITGPNVTDPLNHQFHVGYSHELGQDAVLTADFTHIIGRKDLKSIEINPLENGVRRLAPAFAAAFGDPNLIGQLLVDSSINRYQYDELAILFERRLARATFRATYVLSGANAYGGRIVGSTGRAVQAQDADAPLAEGEWGPPPSDERHRVVLFGVFDLPFGFQVSPIFQAATARPYTLLAGSDLNKDGTQNDRYVDPTTGKQVSIGTQRGDPFSILDVRMTKFFSLPGENRRIGVFAEVFNLFNTANFGDAYQGNSRSRVFKQPIGFIPGNGYPFQLQLGARVEF